jgi:hypothetical protein
LDAERSRQFEQLGLYRFRGRLKPMASERVDDLDYLRAVAIEFDAQVVNAILGKLVHYFLSRSIVDVLQ